MAPRLTSPKKRSTLHLASFNPPGNDAAPNPRATQGDNSAAIEEADRVRFISVLSRLSQADEAIESAMGPVRAARKARSQIIGLGKAAGFTAKELERRLEEMSMGTRETAAMAARELKQRRWAGILNPEQAELILGNKAPEAAKDEAHWAGEGYKAGLRQMRNTPPTECGSFGQAYMKAHERGLNEILLANAPKPMAPTPAEQAAADYAADNPEVDVEKAARALKKSAFMERGGPDASPEGPESDDGFEAKPEELAAQAGRPGGDTDVV